LNQELQNSGHISGSEENVDHSRPGDYASPLQKTKKEDPLSRMSQENNGIHKDFTMTEK
jgi:hypothetical protein